MRRVMQERIDSSPFAYEQLRQVFVRAVVEGRCGAIEEHVPLYAFLDRLRTHRGDMTTCVFSTQSADLNRGTCPILIGPILIGVVKQELGDA